IGMAAAVRGWTHLSVPGYIPLRLSVLCHFRSSRKPYGDAEGKRFAATHSRKPSSSTEYCLDSIRKYDYENFLATLLLPKGCRQSAIAVRAFNIEVAQIQDLTSEPLMAKMRIQFWRDTLDQIFAGKPPKQPIASELCRAIEKHKLSKRWLRNIINSREQQVDIKQYTNMAAVEEYSEKSNASLYYLLLQCLGIENIHSDHAASHIGKAEGIVKLLRGIPHHGVRRKVYIPRDLMLVHNVSQEDIFRGKREQKVKDLIYEIASLAHHHLEHARGFISDVPKESRVALLPGICTGAYLKALQMADFDIFDPKLQQRNNWLPFLLWWSKLKKQY
ncbi:unnamed protein product, partial [Meganyctiphanes norvegica]